MDPLALGVISPIVVTLSETLTGTMRTCQGRVTRRALNPGLFRHQVMEKCVMSGLFPLLGQVLAQGMEQGQVARVSWSAMEL